MTDSELDDREYAGDLSPEEVEDWNAEMLEDIRLDRSEIESLVVMSRDWTVETVVNQIQKGNIELNPKFQRRNAWDDHRRSRLIESLIIGVPVPQIVLAEDPNKKKSFIVIDGKQRLLTLAGFLHPKEYVYWQRPRLKGLGVRKDLNGCTYEKLSCNLLDTDSNRQLLNADIRCTILTNYTSQDVLYDVFYRLNTTSAPLSSQELRQVLNRGEFADYLSRVTSTTQPIHEVLGLREPDPRLRDIEVILRFMSFSLFGSQYDGNLKRFLDLSMFRISRDWPQWEDRINRLYAEFNEGTKRLLAVFPERKVGRKYADDCWESRFNRALFEVEVYYFARLDENAFDMHAHDRFVEDFKVMCDSNAEFRASVESTTKTPERYYVRFSSFLSLVNAAYGTDITDLPVPDPGQHST